MTEYHGLHKWAQYHDPEFPEFNEHSHGEKCECYGCRQLRRYTRDYLGYEDGEWTEDGVGRGPND